MAQRTKPPSRGHLFWRKEFYSFHSNPHMVAEQEWNGDYRFGVWRNVWKWRLGGVVIKLAPRLWRWWVNRPQSKARREIEKAFPKLRG